MEVKKQAEAVEVKRYTGVVGLQVVAINPSLEELKALGGYAAQEPVYLGEKDGTTTCRIDIWVKNEEAKLLSKFSLFLENKDAVAKSGKIKIVNDTMQNTWADSIDALKANTNMSWFKTETARHAKQGEVELLEFFHKWLGLSYGNREKEIPADNCRLNMADIFKGNFKEMQKFVKPCLEGGNGVKLLSCVREVEKDGKTNYYQDFYLKYIMLPSNRMPYAKLAETLAGEYGECKGNYQNSFEFKEFVPGFIQPDTAAKVATAATSNSPF